LEDIAHSLSQQCRFSGHTLRFYSVAEHSWLVAKRARELLPTGVVSNVAILAALMHDAAEAYIGDVTTPLRRALDSTALVSLEQRINQMLAERFHLADDPTTLTLVNQADQDLLAIEQRDLMATPPQHWGIGTPPVSTAVKIIGMSPRQAEQTFLRSAQQYGLS